MIRLPAFAVLAGTLAALPQLAAAHAVLIDSTPAPLGHVAAGKLAVTLRYNSRIDAGRSKLVLVHGDDRKRLTQQDAASEDTLRTGLDLQPGDYTIRWQVLATDGHITRGDVPFTVDGVAAAALATTGAAH